MHTGHSGMKIALSAILSIVFLAIGIGSLITSFGLTLPLPAFLLTETFTEIALVAAGLLLFIDSFSARTPMGMIKTGTIIVSLLLAAIGAIPLLVRYKMLSFLPVLATLSIPPLVLSGLLVFYGLYMLFMVFQMYKAKAMGFA